MELGQRLDLAKLGLSDPVEDSSNVSADGDALTQLSGLLAQIGAVDSPEEVTAADSFDSLSIDSLTRIELAVRVEEHFGVRVDEEMFAHVATVDDLASHLTDHAEKR